jgi:catechol 2,3-dioxygenase-like lactoylglutathione lyase family enzyme
VKIHHVAFRVTDLQSSVRFYREVLRLRLRKDESPRSVWLDIDRDSVLMLEARGAREPTIASGSLELVAFRVSDREKLRIRQVCIEAGCFDGETLHTVYLRDPDGRRIGVSTYLL